MSSSCANGADDRFQTMHTAPTFKSYKHDKKKVKVDDRFKGLLNDERFQSVGGNVDRYGRKAKGEAKGADKVADEMKQFYEIDTGAEEKPEEDQKKRSKRKGPSGAASLSADARLEYLTRLSRGELSDTSSSSDAESDDSDSSSSESDADSDSEIGGGATVARATEVAGAGWGRGQLGALSIPDQLAPLLSNGGVDGLVDSTRLAVQNCDWDSLCAEDIMYVDSQNRRIADLYVCRLLLCTGPRPTLSHHPPLG
jgi:hypothetical protein